ncbi:MAG: MFS transporter [Candidatus Thermoplasmatota archaeon]|nr:MFS transporter [Candidatus Thermoplasmatota archaeon]MCL5790627.1 MFS transporter [Candidatus Thermoplasmatota archaeon]
MDNDNSVPLSYSRRWRLWYSSYISSNLSAGLLNPMIPLFISIYFDRSVIFVGIASSLSSLSSVIALILWGNISDNVKRRKIFVLIGFLGSFVSLFLIAFIYTIYEYIGVLVMYQFFAMASVPVSTLLVIENENESQWARVVGSFSAISTIGTVLGLAFGLVIVIQNPDSISVLKNIYLISSLFYLVSFVLAFFLLRESTVTVRRNSIPEIFSLRMFERSRYAPSYVIHIIRLFGKKSPEKISSDLKLYLLVCIMLMLGFQLFFTPYPVLLIERFNASEPEVYMMYLLNSAFSVISFRMSSGYIRKRSLERAMYLPLSLRVVLFSATAIIPFFAFYSFQMMVIVILLYGFMGFLWSFISITQITTVTRMASSRLRGRAVGYYNSILGVGQILGALISGFLVSFVGFGYDFMISAAIVLLGLVAVARMGFKIKSLDSVKTQINKEATSQ